MIDLKTAKPREIEGYLREVILRTLGDAVENKSDIHASRGYYSVHIELPTSKYVEFQNFRRSDVPKIVKVIRALK
jgi:hypothetical protein